VISSSEAWPVPAERDSIRGLIEDVWARRWWILAATVTVTMAAILIAFLTTPVYRASVVMVPAAAERGGLGGGLGAALGQIGGLASIAGINLNSSGIETEEALAVLRSREFTETFIRDKQLLPKLFRKKWDSQAGTWRDGEDPPTAAQAYRYFHRKVRSIQQDQKTGLVTLQIDWRDREEAAQWANELVARLNAEMRARAIAQADASVGYLEKELESTATLATREAISRLIEAQIKQRMLANVTQEYAFRVADKAMPADANDPIRPKKAMLIASGVVLGLGLGVLMALLARWWNMQASPRVRS
jgi:uncharacterized protein involved in exopolysaccharide biosynthesis